jgi:hypothetical protein
MLLDLSKLRHFGGLGAKPDFSDEEEGLKMGYSKHDWLITTNCITDWTGTAISSTWPKLRALLPDSHSLALHLQNSPQHPFCKLISNNLSLSGPVDEGQMNFANL